MAKFRVQTSGERVMVEADEYSIDSDARDVVFTFWKKDGSASERVASFPGTAVVSIVKEGVTEESESRPVPASAGF